MKSLWNAQCAQRSVSSSGDGACLETDNTLAHRQCDRDANERGAVKSAFDEGLAIVLLSVKQTC